VRAPQVRRVDRASKSKIFHIIHIRHRDEVEIPITDWLREAYELSDLLSSNPGGESQPKPKQKKQAKAEQKIGATPKSKNRP
jgi:5,10-methenyltetrahydromethanopterin hydrogenase